MHYVSQPLGLVIILAANTSMLQDESAAEHDHAGAAEHALCITTIGISDYTRCKYINAPG